MLTPLMDAIEHRASTYIVQRKSSHHQSLLTAASPARVFAAVVGALVRGEFCTGLCDVVALIGAEDVLISAICRSGKCVSYVTNLKCPF